MQSLAARKAKEKKAREQVELTDDEKFVIRIQQEVSDYMSLFRACSFGHHKQVEKLLDEKVNVDSYDSESGNPPLILASRQNYAKVVQLLIERGRCNVNAVGYAGMSALHHACKNDCIEVVKYLLDEGASSASAVSTSLTSSSAPSSSSKEEEKKSLFKLNVEAEDDFGHSSVHICCRMGNLKCLELLIAKGANIEHANKRGVTPFMSAVLNGRTAIVDYLLKRGAPASSSTGAASAGGFSKDDKGAGIYINLNNQDRDGNTALHYAAKCGYTRLVKALLFANVKTNIENNEGMKAEDVALTDAIRSTIKSYGEIAM